MAQATPAPDLRSSLNLWHKRVNVISGDMTLQFRHAGIRRDTLRGWVLELRALADQIERLL